MQFLRQGAEESLQVYDNVVVAASVNGREWSPVTVTDARITLDTAECGRLDVTLDGQLREFTVLPVKSYDAFVLGAAYFEVDVKRVNGSSAERLADFANVGYDTQKHAVSVDRVKVVERVEEPVRVYAKETQEALAAIGRAVVALHDPKRVVSADVVTLGGVPVQEVVGGIVGSLEALDRKDVVVKANVVQMNGRALPVVNLADLATQGYNADTHSVQRVHEVQKVGTVSAPVKAEITGLGDDDVLKNIVAAFTTGYSFPGCSMPLVDTVKNTTHANVVSIGADKRAMKNMQAAFTTGYDFVGCSMPRVRLTEEAPTISGLEAHLDELGASIEDLKNAKVEPVTPPDIYRVNVVELGGDELAVENLKRAFDGRGWDFRNCVMDIRLKGGERAAKQFREITNEGE
ncbi:MAG TPA: hypothetical protein VMZ92_21590 [Planctomycetota bacterium]|nr:hypothetical protein [Planctomycetota bacterium]